MNLTSTGSASGSGCFTVARALGAIVLLCGACGSSDEPPSGPDPAPETTEAPALPSAGGEPANATSPSAAAPAAASGAAPGESSGSGASEASSEGAPDVSALEPPAAEAAPGKGAAEEPPAEEPAAPEGTEPAGEEPEPAAPEEIDPTTDENLAFILEDGFETTYFAVHCSAIGEDGSEIDGDTVTELPVGGGFLLECTLDSLPSRATTDVLSAANEPWCALGELTSFETDGDERLEITLTSPPDSPSPTLIATSDEPITLQLASAFGAFLWPVWLVTRYDAVEVARAEQGKLCDEVFGL